MKEMGCNAIRTAHNPPDPQVLEYATDWVWMVMDEAFDCWETGRLPMTIICISKTGQKGPSGYG